MLASYEAYKVNISKAKRNRLLHMEEREKQLKATRTSWSEKESQIQHRLRKGAFHG